MRHFYTGSQPWPFSHFGQTAKIVGPPSFRESIIAWREAPGVVERPDSTGWDWFIPGPRWRMPTLTMLLIVWGVLTVVLILLLIYRSTLSMHEDDQLFLDESSKNLREEQEQVLARMNKVTPWVRILGAASAVLILVIAGMAVWQRMNAGY